MHLIIWGDEKSGNVTINADGVRVRLKKTEGGGWEPTDQGKLDEARAACATAVGSVLSLLSTTPRVKS